MEKRRKSASLLPVGVFLVFYLGLGILFEYIMKIPMGFYNVPIVVAFLAALLVACLQNRKVGFDEKCRAEADWLVGINATRALTCKYNAQLSCGRVQTPTLAMIAKREEKIRSFIPEGYYGMTAKGQNIMLTWQDQKSKYIKCRTLIQSGISDYLHINFRRNCFKTSTYHNRRSKISDRPDKRKQKAAEQYRFQ